MKKGAKKLNFNKSVLKNEESFVKRVYRSAVRNRQSAASQSRRVLLRRRIDGFEGAVKVNWILLIEILVVT